MTACEIGALQNNPLEAGHDPRRLLNGTGDRLKAEGEAYFKISTQSIISNSPLSHAIQPSVFRCSEAIERISVAGDLRLRRTTKNICRIGPLIASEKQISQNGTGVVRNSCVSKVWTRRPALVTCRV